MSILSSIQTMADDELYQSACNLPIQMTIMDVANFLGVSRSSAYKLTHMEGFPVVRLAGMKRQIIPKKLFLDWYSTLLNGETYNGDRDILAVQDGSC